MPSMSNIPMPTEQQQIVQALLKGKTPEQQAVIKYFLGDPSCCGCGACFNKLMTDAEYDEKVAEKIRLHKLDTPDYPADKLGFNMDQQEFPPIRFAGYKFEDALVKKTEQGLYVSSNVEVTWIFFAPMQVMFYTCLFVMIDSKVRENTLEFFYKDITAISTSDKTVKAKYVFESSKIIVNSEVGTTEVRIVVPGDSLYLAMDKDENNDSKIQTIKRILREKKQG